MKSKQKITTKKTTHIQTHTKRKTTNHTLENEIHSVHKKNYRNEKV